MVKIGYMVEDFEMLKKAFPGVARKVAMQVKAFQGMGMDCSVLSVKTRGGMWNKVARRLPCGSDGKEWPDEDIGACDFLYIRKPIYFSKEFVRFLKKKKQENRKLRVLVEIPTYPYEQEYTGVLRPLIWKERGVLGELADVVDRVVDLSGADEIFGIPTIQITNGIDLDEIKPRHSRVMHGDKTVNLACAATFADWHGVDRVLRGLKEYQERGGVRNVVVHLMGEGPEIDNLKRMAHYFGIENRVVFYGRCDQSMMDKIYDQCSMGIASLGMHRIGLSLASTLKTREYLAKGLPFVYSGEIDVFEGSQIDFCHRISEDDDPLDITKLIAFHDSLYDNESEDKLIARIRRFADARIGIDKTMAGVFDYIKESGENCE